MASQSRTASTSATIHVPKNVTRHGSSQRDWIASRMRLVRRVTLVVSLAGGAVFTGLALGHSTNPGNPATTTTVQSSNQLTSAQQLPNAPSQSLFNNQGGENFSVAPAPAARVTTTRIRSVSS